MTERISVGALALLTLLSVWLAPWAALTREIGGRSALLLLPNRVLDLTGRTSAPAVPGQSTILVLTGLALALVAGAALAPRRVRYGLWLFAGVALLVTTAVGLGTLQNTVARANFDAVRAEAQSALESPSARTDTAALEAVLQKDESLETTLSAVRGAGVRIRNLPFEGAGVGLSAFLSLVTGALALLFGLRLFRRAGALIDRFLAAVAVPAVSILLALLAAAVVVLLLQPTPVGSGVVLEGWHTVLAGRLDTVWYAYQTLFAGSLGTLPGFLEALKFATPLIFTGLSVAFAFQAGLFNIGAPGQMVLGAIFAMLAGVYLPGPRVLVLPAAVLAAAVGGGLWGALPGWLKARFGANEVINTILLNYIAASLLLFILSSNQTFAAPAVRIIWVIAAFAVLAILLNLIAPLRRFFTRRTRLVFAIGGVLLLAGVVVAGLPRAGDAPVTLSLPFKVPGSEPKSYPLTPEARLSQVPTLFGIDSSTNPGTNVVGVNYALPVALLVALLMLALAPRINRRLRPWVPRLIVSLVVGGVAYGVAALAGLLNVPTAIPPTQLNTSFLIALVSALLMYVLLWRTKWGYELRAVGVAPKAAEYGGASIARNIILAMSVSGAFAGLSATHYVLGGALEDYALRQSLPTGDGFDGIAVALLGGNTPIGVILSAFLFGVLKNGGSILNITFSDLTRDVVSMILALVVLFIAARGFLPDRLTDPLRRGKTLEGDEYAELDPERTAPLDPPGRPVRSEPGEGL